MMGSAFDRLDLSAAGILHHFNWNASVYTRVDYRYTKPYAYNISVNFWRCEEKCI